ncbi:hypothetical protein APX70_200503 [Pseudomonas syringae pv. maculicola]|uniref:Uncharacterized protein n=1 Tax=Pseudomonas syringae pv. maculicola TaxID=59511 RepID=A0A3M2ZHL7_PSEYM|nr:hypothetical protein APX70_200503 [Pseudomonas syringae pv. maculicola]
MLWPYKSPWVMPLACRCAVTAAIPVARRNNTGSEKRVSLA